LNKKSGILAVVLALLAVVSMTFCAPVSAENITILSSSGWIDSTGHYRIVGEVQNTGSTTARNVELSITLYDSKNTILENYLTIVKLAAMPSGTKSPFSTVSFGHDSNYQSYNVHQVDHYDIRIHAFNWLPPQMGLQISPNGLQILSNRSYTDSKGYIHVDGEIQNIGTATSNHTYIFATFYDSSGKVVDVAQAGADADYINSGDTAPFKIRGFDTTRTPLFASYSLTAESNNYGLNSVNLPQSPIPIQTSPTPTVQEFPILAILPLFVAIPLITTMLLRKKQSSKSL
jgi:hypothetical protein